MLAGSGEAGEDGCRRPARGPRGQGVVGEIGGEAMPRRGRMHLIPEQILVLDGWDRRGQRPGSGAGEIASPDRVVDVGEAEGGRVALDVAEQIIGVQVEHLEAAEALERDEVSEHGLVERLRQATGKALKRRFLEGWRARVAERRRHVRRTQRLPHRTFLPAALSKELYRKSILPWLGFDKARAERRVDSELTCPVLVAHQMSASSGSVLLWDCGQRLGVVHI